MPKLKGVSVSPQGSGRRGATQVGPAPWTTLAVNWAHICSRYWRGSPGGAYTSLLVSQKNGISPRRGPPAAPTVSPMIKGLALNLTGCGWHFERRRGRQGDNRHVEFERELQKAPIRWAEPTEGMPFDTIGLKEPEHPKAKLSRPGCKTI